MMVLAFILASAESIVTSSASLSFLASHANYGEGSHVSGASGVARSIRVSVTAHGPEACH